MSTGLNTSSQLNDDQIEDLAREYTQYEVNSQTFYESQSQQIIDEPSTNPNANHDFQAEFLKCMFNADQIEHIATNVRTNYEPGPQCDYDSQTDIETVVQTFMTGNPNWNENIASKPMDMRTFLETRDYFVTIKPVDRPAPSKSVADNHFTIGPLPLEIEDIHRIIINTSEVQQWNTYQRIYGQKIKTVMFYGRCKPCGDVRAQKQRNVKLYEIDDGSGMIIVHFPHFDAKYSAMSRGIERLMDEYALAKREGIPYLGMEHFRAETAKCQTMLQNVNILINIIQRNGAIKQEFFKHGCKVCVIGRVFGHSDGTNHVFAYHIIEDDNVCRDFEIKFKHHLIDVYATKYLKYMINGQPIVPKDN